MYNTKKHANIHILKKLEPLYFCLINDSYIYKIDCNLCPIHWDKNTQRILHNVAFQTFLLQNLSKLCIVTDFLQCCLLVCLLVCWSMWEMHVLYFSPRFFTEHCSVFSAPVFYLPISLPPVDRQLCSTVCLFVSFDLFHFEPFYRVDATSFGWWLTADPHGTLQSLNNPACCIT